MRRAGLTKAFCEKGKTGLNLTRSGLTGSGFVLGTPHYIAPEQIEDAPKADIRADLYSLGCTLYFLLAGRPPFEANSVIKLLDAHRRDEPVPIGQVRPEVPDQLAMAIRKLMAKDPGRRYQTPSEVAVALEPLVKSGEKLKPIAVLPVPPLTPLTSTGTSRRFGRSDKPTGPAQPLPPTKVERFEGKKEDAKPQARFWFRFLITMVVAVIPLGAAFCFLVFLGKTEVDTGPFAFDSGDTVIHKRKDAVAQFKVRGEIESVSIAPSDQGVEVVKERNMVKMAVKDVDKVGATTKFYITVKGTGTDGKLGEFTHELGVLKQTEPDSLPEELIAVWERAGAQTGQLGDEFGFLGLRCNNEHSEFQPMLVGRRASDI